MATILSKLSFHILIIFLPFIFSCFRQIGHFRVLLCLCFKTSLSAKPFIWKWVLPAVSFSCKSVIFMRMVSHLGSLCNRGTRELGNGLFNWFLLFNYDDLLLMLFSRFEEIMKFKRRIQNGSCSEIVKSYLGHMLSYNPSILLEFKVDLKNHNHFPASQKKGCWWPGL